MKRPIKESLIFILIVIGASFLVFWGPLALFKIPAIGFSEETTGPVWAVVLFITGGFVPSLAGIMLTGIYDKKEGMRNMLLSTVRFRGNTKYIIMMILTVIAYAVLYIAVCLLTAKTFDFSQFYKQLPTLLPLLILGPLSEEFGWRGFLLKRLLKVFNPNIAGLLVGIIWSVWHIPLFYIIGTTQYESGLPLGVFIISVTVISLPYTYFHLKTKGSMLLAVLLHWLTTYVMQVMGTTVERNELYNTIEFVPALIIGMVFAVLIVKDRKKGKRNLSFIKS